MKTHFSGNLLEPSSVLQHGRVDQGLLCTQTTHQMIVNILSDVTRSYGRVLADPEAGVRAQSGLESSIQNLQQTGFARSRSAHQGDQRAKVNGPRQIVQYDFRLARADNLAEMIFLLLGTLFQP